MNLTFPEKADLGIRPVQHRDLDALSALAEREINFRDGSRALGRLQQLRRWYGAYKFLSFVPTPAEYDFCGFVAEWERQILGWIEVSPLNKSRSTWRVEHLLLGSGGGVAEREVGSLLLRYCFETIWEARTWIVETDIHQKNLLGLYRHNGFQPLANLTYWAISPAILAELAENEPKLPNLLPASNPDATLLYQLDSYAMPPLLRQVFDRNPQDFRTHLLGAIVDRLRQWMMATETIRGYVFEPQRKAAIGHFNLEASRSPERPHKAKLTVNPAYTWLYPQLLTHMARVLQGFPLQPLSLASADYQPEREAYLEQLGAERVEHTLLMSRSVWHKLRETRSNSLERLQLSGVFQGLQPGRSPIPSRLPWLAPLLYPKQHSGSTQQPDNGKETNGDWSSGSQGDRDEEAPT